ncbi:hypothetical protein BH09PLA1_BH09PLA1_12930 [soil metagenome]
MHPTRKSARIARGISHEMLELRRLLSATLDSTTGLLTVIGTDNPDQIQLSLVANSIDVLEGGQHSLFASAAVRSILIQALGGDDSARIATDFIRQPATIVGGEGNDTLRGGGGSDSLSGGDGDDVLDGGRRGDVLSGGAGRDTLDYRKRSEDLVVIQDDLQNDGAAGEGDNVSGDIEDIRGGSGNDRFVGNGKSNRFYGYAGNDTLQGEKGNDTLVGGDGDDSIIGNGGNDLMIGEAGSDTFSADAVADGNDTVKGDLADDNPASGDDTWDYSRRVSPLDISNPSPTTSNLEATSDGETDSGFGLETVVGGRGDDVIGFTFIFSDQTPMVLRIDGGDGDDRLLLYANTSRDIVVNGDRGNDRLIAFNGAFDTSSFDEIYTALLFGGDGDDYLDAGSLARGYAKREWHGGGGVDVVDMSQTYYVGSHVMTLNNIADDGFTFDVEQGGQENIFDDVETLIAPSHTLMQGSDADNTLIAYGGGCTMLGEGGNDTFFNNDGFGINGGSPDTVDGGDGIDSYQEDPNDSISAETELAFDRLSPASAPRAITRGAPAQGMARLVGTELRVSGTTSADNITLWEDYKGIHVTIDGPGLATPYAIAPIKTKFVKRIRIVADSGDDVVKLGLGATASISRVTRDAQIYGGDGDDVIFGGDAQLTSGGDLRGGNWLIGGRGNDSLVGGNGADVLDGGDQFANLQSDGNDTLDGGTGNDAIDYSARLQDLTLNLSAPITRNQGANGEADVLMGIEVIRSGFGNDVLATRAIGGGVIAAGKGNDRCTGGIGRDVVTDVGGNDIIDVSGDSNVDILQVADGDADQCMLGEEDKSKYDIGLDIMNIV